MTRRFHPFDVFTAAPLKGNPPAVLPDAAGLADERRAAYAAPPWRRSGPLEGTVAP